MSETEEPMPATVVRFDALDQVGALALSSGEVVRVGVTACRGFVPKVRARVWVVELAPHPLGGRRVTRVHDTALTIAAFDAEAQRLKDLERTGQRVEARAWLSEHPTGDSAEGMNVEAPDFVARLYEAGATEVRVWAKIRGEQTWADLMEVALPTDDDAGQTALTLWWD